MFLGALAVQWVVFRDLRLAYYPSNDDLVLFLRSTPHDGLPMAAKVREWFAEGFLTYWRIYPDWWVPGTNFVRPLFNLSLLALYGLLGDHWSLYPIVGYVVRAALVVAALAIAVRLFKAPRGALMLIGAIALFTPAAWTTGEPYFYVAFIFDAVAALIILAAFWTYVERWYGVTAICLLVALLTKDTAIFAVAAACSGVLVREWRSASRRAVWAALLMGSPLVVWGALRWFAFGATTGIAVIDASPGAYPVLRYVRQMLRWPFCVGFLEGPAIDLIKQGDLAGVSSGAYLQIVLNAGCWGLCAAAAWSRWSEVRSGAKRTSDGDRFDATAIWAGWVLLFMVATSAEARIGELPPIVAAWLLAWTATSHSRRLTRATALALLCLATVMSISAARGMFARQRVAQIVERFDLQRELVRIVQQEAAEGRAVLIVDDLSGFSSGEDVRRFARSPGRVIRVNGIDYIDDRHVGPPPASARHGSTTLDWTASTFRATVALPAHLRFMFHQVNRDRILATRIGDTFVQGECRYRFPDLDVPARGNLDYGARLKVECDAAGDTVAVYFDTIQHRYARSRRPAATTARQTPR